MSIGGLPDAVSERCQEQTMHNVHAIKGGGRVSRQLSSMASLTEPSQAPGNDAGDDDADQHRRQLACQSLHRKR